MSNPRRTTGGHARQHACQMHMLHAFIEPGYSGERQPTTPCTQQAEACPGGLRVGVRAGTTIVAIIQDQMCECVSNTRKQVSLEKTLIMLMKY